MNIWHCIKKVRNEKNNITGYILVNLRNSNQKLFEPDTLKNLMKSSEIIIDNLRLTQDGKLIDHNKDNNIVIDKYKESCKLLGIKPLTIQCIKGKYIVTNAPKDTKLIIPSFIHGIQMNKNLNPSNVSIVVNDASNNELEQKLDALIAKTDEIILEQKKDKQRTNNGIYDIKKQLSDMQNNLKDLPAEMSIVTDYINSLTKDKIEANKKYDKMLSNLTDTILKDCNKNLLEQCRILDKDSIPNNSRMLSKYGNILVNEATYASPTANSNINNYINYNKVHELSPYINYAYNLHEIMLNKSLIKFNINPDKDLDDAKTFIELIFNWMSYLLSAGLIYAAFSFPTAVASTTAAVAVAGTGFARDALQDFSSLTFNNAEWFEEKRKKKSLDYLSKEIHKQFPELENTNRYLNNYLDKEVFLFTIESLLIYSSSFISRLNKSDVYNKAILKTLYRLKYSDGINYKEIDMHIKACYLAACIYVNEKCKFKNDIDNDKIHYIVSKCNKVKLRKNTDVFKHLDAEEKLVLTRQSYYYSFVIKYFEAVMYLCGIRQEVVNYIIDIFHEETRHLGMEPTDISVELFRRPQDLDISRLIIN